MPPDARRPNFSDLLNATPTSHPDTWLLISTALLVGRMVAMHYKHKFDHPRPVQVNPALMPPLLTPPHPSYPNAHALQANLMAECVALACPAMAEPLRALADRIGENREVAGVHYPSDRQASLKLVPQVMKLLKAGLKFKAALEHARAEWKSVGASVGPMLAGSGKPDA